MNTNELSAYVRDLTGVYTTDVVSDALVLRWLNESYKEIARLEQWSWLPISDLVGGATPNSPAFDAQYHQVLSYRAAIRVLNFVGDDTARSQFFAQESESLIADMRRNYFPATATGDNGTRANLRRLTRDLMNVYDNSVSDSMINVALNDAYIELANVRDWDWLEASVDVAMPAFTSGKHTVNLSSGTRRVISAYIVDDNDNIREMVQVPTLDDAEAWKYETFYDVTSSGVVTFAPEQPASSRVRIRYTRSIVSLSGDSSTPEFSSSFTSILAYRAAAKLLLITGKDTTRVQSLLDEYSSLLASMTTAYELDADYRTIQLGGDGQLTRKYYPWFKTIS